MIPHKAFIVADIPDPYNATIQHLRDQLNTVTAKFPVEITLAGSSGVGPIPEGTNIGLIREEVDRVATSTPAFTLEFDGIDHFPDTGVFFFLPKDRRPFDSLHAALGSSKIPFYQSQFPYRPHCTLRVGPKVEESIAEQIRSIPVPIGDVLIDTISVYAVDEKHFAVNLLHRARLKLSQERVKRE